MQKIKSSSTILLTGVFLLSIITQNIMGASSYYSRSSSDMFLWLPLIFFGIIAAIIVAYILIAYWVYKDANKRGENGMLWALLVVVGGLIVIIIWFVIRPPIGGKKTSSDRRCPSCGRIIPFDSIVCPYCGKKFESFL